MVYPSQAKLTVIGAPHSHTSNSMNFHYCAAQKDGKNVGSPKAPSRTSSSPCYFINSTMMPEVNVNPLDRPIQGAVLRYLDSAPKADVTSQPPCPHPSLLNPLPPSTQIVPPRQMAG